MLLRDWSRPFETTLRIFWDDDDGSGGGGGDGGDNDKITVSRDELEKIIDEKAQKQVGISMQRQRKTLQKKAKQLEEMLPEFEQLKQEREELQKQLVEATSGADDDKVPKSKLEFMEERYEKEMALVRKSLDEERQVRLVAEQRTRETLRDQMIKDALVKAGCNDMTIGYRWVLPDVKYMEGEDRPEDQWVVVFRDDDNTEMESPIEEYIEHRLPDNLRSPKMRGGGSGSQTGSPKRRAVQDDVERLEQEHKTAYKTAMSTQRASDQLRAEQLRVALAKKKAELKAMS